MRKAPGATRPDDHGAGPPSPGRGTVHDLAIVGAGPAGLAVALAVRHRAPEVRLTVVDPTGEWLTVWHRQFARQGIPHLRSPAVHHPHPEPYGLLAGACDEDLAHSGGARLPTTERFAEFCDETIAEFGLVGAVTTGRVTSLSAGPDGATLEVTDPDGLVNRERHDRVVVATNHRTPVVPAWAVVAPGVRLAADVDVRSVVEGTRIAVVGGGMTAGHLCMGAVDRGAVVHHVTRGRLRVRRFDTDPGWLGPKQLGPFGRISDAAERRRRVAAARGGGSVTHRIAGQLGEARRRGAVVHHERCRVTRVEGSPQGGGVRVHLDGGTHVDVDEVWLATGGAVDVAADPLLGPLLERHPAPVLDGLPVLDHDLRWPGTEVHVVGAVAALELGPLAGNLHGHRRAAARVVESIPGVDARAVRAARHYEAD